MEVFLILFVTNVCRIYLALVDHMEAMYMYVQLFHALQLLSVSLLYTAAQEPACKRRASFESSLVTSGVWAYYLWSGHRVRDYFRSGSIIA